MKNAIITGASRGIGAAVAHKFAQKGYNLFLLALHNIDAMEAMAEQWRGQFGISVKTDMMDICDEQALKDYFKNVFGPNQSLEVLVNCAGVMHDALLGMTTGKQIDQVLQTNLRASITLAQLASKIMMRKKTGSIVLVSSIIGLNGAAGQSVYSASKAGLVGFCKSLAKEIGPGGIRVNAVAPGFIDTDMVKHYNEKRRNDILSRISLGRLGTAEDVSDAIYFLATDQARYITGQVLGIDGGMVV